MLRFRKLITPVGPLLAAANDAGLALLEFHREDRLARQMNMLQQLFGPVEAGNHSIIDVTERELDEYFAGTRREFAVPLQIRGTPFQEEVWRALLGIPYGETRAYSGLAEQLERPGAQRAVGLANGQNRISIIIPCHRVIERSGGLRGYGGGLERKKFLLDLERRVSRRDDLDGTPLGELAE